MFGGNILVGNWYVLSFCSLDKSELMKVLVGVEDLFDRGCVCLF